MKTTLNKLLAGMGVSLAVIVLPDTVLAQCNAKVNHTSGTQLVGCTEVTVTSSGSAGNATICGKGPFIIGNLGEGSYTFNFSPAVTGVRLGVYAINNNLLGEEEIVISINGAFYPLTVPGVPDACLEPAAISATGTIRTSCNNCTSSWDDVVITENINSLTVEDNYLSGGPAGVLFYLYLCCPDCPTEAGTINGTALNICATGPATVPATAGSFLDNNDLLQYILFSDPNDTLGSILLTGNSPQFSFNPAILDFGIPYYIAAIAGNGVGGNVSLSDTCLSVSNAIPVTWHPIPAVSFSMANPNVCAGECTDVTATFTGTAPFTLSYSTSGNGPVTQSFQDNVSTFQVCVPQGAPPGSFAINATEIVDAHCSCK